jgi:predicted nuclease of restriction endonuclease-like (RecB) superfamily
MPDKNKISASDYASFLASIKTQIQTARIKAARVVNKELITLYWKIGEMVVKKQEELGWGKSVVEKLSKDIYAEFDNIQGFSPQNLWYMRQFYIEYAPYPNLQQLVGEIPWGHNILIIEKIKDLKERLWYAQQTIENGLSRHALENWIASKAYKRQGKAITNFSTRLPSPQSALAQEILTLHYALKSYSGRSEQK